MKREVFERYVSSVCNAFKITEEELFTKTRAPELSEPRHMLYYVCRVRPMSIKAIESYLRERGFNTSYTSIAYGISSMKEKVLTDQDYGRMADKIIEDDFA